MAEGARNFHFGLADQLQRGIQGGNKLICNLQGRFRVEVRDHKPQVSSGLEPRHVHALLMSLIEIDMTCRRGSERASAGQLRAVVFGQYYGENRAAAARNEMHVLPRTSGNRADVGFENFEPGQVLMHDIEQSCVLRPEFLAQYFGGIRDLRVIVPFDGALDMVRDAERQHAGHDSPSSHDAHPFVRHDASQHDDRYPRQRQSPV